ncbi:MAG: efflux RND transporter permease subunit [Gammaproteobacteria bacterium]|nr:efflux RND transporter permease subunit [Gammaproteobacteria bacterium]
MWLVRLALARPYTFVVLAILLFILGVMSILRTSTDIFPAVDIPVVSVVWSYSDMSPYDMATRVTTVFELAATTTVNNIEHMESQSLLSVSIIKLYFQRGTDIAVAIAQVTSIAQTMLKYLPPGMTPPFVLNYNATTVPVINVLLSSKSLTEQKLNDLANNFVRPQLAAVQGASIPPGYGGKTREIMLDINTKGLQEYGLSAQDVNHAMMEQNLIIPGGTEKIGKTEYIVNFNNSPLKAEDMNYMPVISAHNKMIYLRDVGHVRDGFPPQTNIINRNSQRAVMLGVEKTGDASTLNVIQRVLDMLPIIKAGLTKALEISTTGNQAFFVKGAIKGVVTEAVTAAMLTAMMILVFLGSVRSTMVITISIPLSILASLSILAALGNTINIMTLGGLALAVGILVDDATVAIENINWNLEQGLALKDAILEGAKQIAIPAIVSTMCICIVFLPMFFLEGVSKYLFIPLAEAVIFAMMASYFLSRTLLPTMAMYLLANENKSSTSRLQRFHTWFEGKFSILQGRYQVALEWILNNEKRFMSIFLGVVALSLLILWPALGSNFFPKVDGGQILLHYSAPPGTRIEETAKIAAEVNRVIREVIPAKDLDSTVDNIGLPISGVNLTYGNSGTNGANDTDTSITLADGHRPTEEYVRKLREVLRQRFQSVQFSFLPASMVEQILNFGHPADIDIQIMGWRHKKNLQYAQMLLPRIRKISGMVDVHMRQSNQYPALFVDVDRTRAKELGFTQQDIGNSLMIELAGSFQTTPNFWVDPKDLMNYQITTQVPQYNIDTYQELLNMPVTNRAHSTAPQILGAMATVKRIGVPLVVTHYNVQPMLDILAGTEQRDMGSIAKDLNRLIKDTKKDLPAGSQIFVRGQLALQQSTFDTLYMGLIFAMLLVYMIIVINFQSWLDPFIIITALPAALAGIAWMLFLTHTTLSVPALTGSIMCMGVATANSILLVSFARDNLAKGQTPHAAALEAGVTRLRPVMMTAFAMMIGMLPMALGLGDGGEQNAPLGRAVIGGLMFATNATLFFVPTVFKILHSRKKPKQELQHV